MVVSQERIKIYSSSKVEPSIFHLSSWSKLLYEAEKHLLLSYLSSSRQCGIIGCFFPWFSHWPVSLRAHLSRRGVLSTHSQDASLWWSVSPIQVLLSCRISQCCRNSWKWKDENEADLNILLLILYPEKFLLWFSLSSAAQDDFPVELCMCVSVKQVCALAKTCVSVHLFMRWLEIPLRCTASPIYSSFYVFSLGPPPEHCSRKLLLVPGSLPWLHVLICILSPQSSNYSSLKKVGEALDSSHRGDPRRIFRTYWAYSV